MLAREKVGDIMVDSAHVCYLTTNQTSFNTKIGNERNAPDCCYFSTEHLRGTYHMYERISEDRTDKVYFIHENYATTIDKQQYKKITEIPVQANLVVSDPCYVLDSQLLPKRVEGGAIPIMYWGGGEQQFNAILSKLFKDVERQPADGSNGWIVQMTTAQFQKVHAAFTKKHPNLRVMMEELDPNKLYSHVMRGDVSHVEYTDNHDQQQFFTGTVSGWGDGYYELYAVKDSAGRVVGFYMDFQVEG